jgi:hypothetical protein
MGYLVAAHLFKESPTPEQLAFLPASIAWTLFHDASFNAFYLDTFSAARAPKWPFTFLPPAKDLPLELPAQLAALSRVYLFLEEEHLANGLKRTVLNLNLALSKQLQTSVCSVYSDDDGLDFASVSANGELQRLRCRCGDLEITYELGQVTVQPLISEDGESTDASAVHDPDAGIVVQARTPAPEATLHAIAASESARFLQRESSPLGLGSFDGLQELPVRIASSLVEPVATKTPARKPWWKVW